MGSHAETLKQMARSFDGLTKGDIIRRNALEAGALALSQPERVCGTCRHFEMSSRTTEVNGTTRTHGYCRIIDSGNFRVPQTAEEFGCSLYQGREDEDEKR